MPWEPNLLNRITITIEANNSQVAKKVLHGSLLHQVNIKNLFNTFFTQHPINHDIYLETLILDLGEINLHNFNPLFRARLNTALNKALNQYQINNQEKKTFLRQSKLQETNNNPSLLHDNNLINIENFIHYLNHKNKALNSIEVIDNYQNIDINIQQLINQLAGIEDKWTLFLAKSCLSEPSLQRLLMLKKPTLLSTINHRLSEGINKPQYPREPVSPGQLILNALQYIQLNNTQEIPKLDVKVLSHITSELDNGTLNATSIITLFRQIITDNIPLNNWLKQIWQTITVAKFSKKYLSTKEYQYLSEHFISNHADKDKSSKKLAVTHVDIKNVHRYNYSTNQEIISENQKIFSASNNPHITENNSNPLQNIDKTHSEYVLLPQQTLPYQVNNAGILVLWPMLPILFNQLGLLEEQKFIHRQAQFSAVNLLNYLIWVNEEIQTELNILNNALCGLMVNEPIESAPVEPEKKLIIDQWLDAIISQLPGWKKLTRNDARQLFLQRPGELFIDEKEIKITVQHQPFDILLADWPWPLNIAKLPWLDCPLKIDWQNI
ncbi:contractile injection system tape measure protein [Photorhabdus caribbeanensis]|uniref:contractile injection system tape measure protein n=1 Tax=Photorhabdus caribbeanensis TaxID=1004165 RepID=UPI001BD39CFD|nr:contractile injection system tape measure protein [Photorhabdus caribbeanensis]MBS9423176.1 hypothetical protein [Photorhabdus caribbeanensis]